MRSVSLFDIHNSINMWLEGVAKRNINDPNLSQSLYRAALLWGASF